MVKYINSMKRKRIARFASFVALFILVVSVYQFYLLFIEKQFKQTAHNFIVELKEQGVTILGDDEKNISYNDKTITLPIIGSLVSESEKKSWEDRLIELGLIDVKLEVYQENDAEMRKQVESLQELYSQKLEIINRRDESIKAKEDQIRLLENELAKFYKDRVPFKNISEEARIIYEDMVKMSYYNRIETDFTKIDSIPVFSIQWKEGVDTMAIRQQELKLNLWLRTRLKLDTLKIVREK